MSLFIIKRVHHSDLVGYSGNGLFYGLSVQAHSQALFYFIYTDLLHALFSLSDRNLLVSSHVVFGFKNHDNQTGLSLPGKIRNGKKQ